MSQKINKKIIFVPSNFSWTSLTFTQPLLEHFVDTHNFFLNSKIAVLGVPKVRF